MKTKMERTQRARIVVMLTMALVMSSELSAKTKPRQESEAQANAPGAVHKRLTSQAGNYTTKTRFRSSPAATPVESSGTAKINAILSGRFLAEENSGTQVGQPISGFRLFGYNNATKQYECSWTYTGSTAILNMVGKSVDDGKTINWEGAFQDPTGGRIPIKARTRVIDADLFVVEMFGKAPDGMEFTVLETTYARHK